MKLPKYIVYTLIGTTIRAFIIAFIGWQFGNHIDAILAYKWPFIIITLFAIGFIIYNPFKKSKKIAVQKLWFFSFTKALKNGMIVIRELLSHASR